MLYEQFLDLINRETKPIIIDVWAPWCGPCKVMKPHFDQLSEEFAEQAIVFPLNADESPEIVQNLEIASIPTVLVFHEGKETTRRVGAQSPKILRELFEATVKGEAIPEISSRSRYLRILGAAGFFIFAEKLTPSWPMYLLAGGLFFWAIHDRCPILQGLKAILKKKKT